MNVLVDTSIWSLVLRRRKGGPSPATQTMQRLIDDYRVCIIGSIRQEVLSGVRSETHFDKLKRHLAAFPDLPVLSEDYVMAARFFNRCRAKGIQGSNTDYLICAVAIRERLAIHTADKDFQRFAQHLPIALFEG